VYLHKDVHILWHIRCSCKHQISKGKGADHEDVLESRGIPLRILNLGTRWRGVVGFTPRGGWVPEPMGMRWQRGKISSLRLPGI
jgi:hypothetical protein